MRHALIRSAVLIAAVLPYFAAGAADEPPPSAEAAVAPADDAAPKVTGITAIDQQLALIKQCTEEKSGQTSESGTFDSIAAQFGDGSNLVSADVFTGFSRISPDSGAFLSRPKALGIHVTSAIPPTSTTLEEYANHALLLRGGGVLNVHFSLLASPNWFARECTNQANEKVAGAPRWYRPFQPDRVYIGYHPVPPLLRPYLVNGLGVKAVRTGLEDQEGEDASGVDAVGSAYFGLGINGPLWDTTEGYTTATPSGTLDLQFVVNAQRMNPSTLRELYGVETEAQWVYSGSVRLSLIATDRLSLGIEYAAPFGATKDIIDGVTLLSIGFQREP